MFDQSKSPIQRRWIHALAWILLLVALNAVGFVAGYFSGYDRGYAGGTAPWLDKPLEQRTYEVGELAAYKPSSPPDLEYLSESVTSIHAESWDDLGGPGTIEITGPTEITVKHTAEMHETIAHVFQAVRDGRRNHGEEIAK